MRRSVLLRAHTVAPPAFFAFAGVAAVAVGVLAATSPMVGAAVALAAIPVYMLTLGQRLVPLLLTSVGIVLLGYAFLGRGFAYAGVPPLFVGDAVLYLAVITLMAVAARVRPTLVHCLIFLFIAWGAARTIPYIQRDGINALRDGVLWGYAFYALALATVLERRHFGTLVARFRRVLPYFLAWVPFAAIASLAAYGAIPTWPVSGQPVMHFKGDMAVHLAAAAAFLLVGLHGAKRTVPSFTELSLWPAWFVGAGIVATQNRGGMLALGTGVAATLLLRTSGSRRLPFVAVAAGLVVVVGVVNPQFDVGKVDKLSLDQVRVNFLSVVGDTGEGSREGNEDFRLAWWGEIVDYTIGGEYFWTGKGFGVNLADDDGFAVDTNGSLRAPHNTHMTVLARMGVPGLIVWIAFQLLFAASLVIAFRRAWRTGALFWARVDAVLLVYWIAMMVQTTFDPYLEGPQGGIWFWSVVGVGLAALRLQRESPDPPESERLAGAPA